EGDSSANGPFLPLGVPGPLPERADLFRRDAENALPEALRTSGTARLITSVSKFFSAGGLDRPGDGPARLRIRLSRFPPNKSEGEASRRSSLLAPPPSLPYGPLRYLSE